MPARPLPSVATLGLGLLAAGLAAQTAGEPARSIGGTWDVKPLVRLNDPLPDTAGALREVGDAFLLEPGRLVFWGRFGEPRKSGMRIISPWSLYAVQDGAVRKVLESGEPFLGPEHKRTWVIRTTEGWYLGSGSKVVFAAGRRMVFWSAKTRLRADLDAVYGWDGARISRLAGPDDSFTSATGRPVVFDTGFLDSITADGRALVYFNASTPRRTFGHLLFDGAKATDCWLENEPAPEIVRRDQANRAAWTAALAPGNAGATMDRPPRREIESVVYLTPAQDRAVVSTLTATTAPPFSTQSLQLFLADGPQLRPLPIPDTSSLRTLLGAPPKLRVVPGLPTAVVELPWTNGPEILCLADLESGPVLGPPPVLRTDGAGFFTVADLVGWKDADHVVVKNATGLFELTRR